MDGVVYGPYSLQEYHGLDVPDDTEVMEESVGEWCLASDYPSFEELNAREQGYILMPDGSLEKIKEDVNNNPNDFEEIVDEPMNEPSAQQSLYSFSQPSAQSTSLTENKPKTGWNWGAFMFNWIWAIFNGLYWPLIIIPIALIPHIGGLASIVFCIVLGFKGNKWAWKAKTWDSAEHFNNVQHRWAVASGIYFLIAFSIALLITCNK